MPEITINNRKGFYPTLVERVVESLTPNRHWRNAGLVRENRSRSPRGTHAHQSGLPSRLLVRSEGRRRGRNTAQRDRFKGRQPLQIYKVPSKALTAEAADAQQRVSKRSQGSGTGKAICLPNGCPTAASAEAGGSPEGAARAEQAGGKTFLFPSIWIIFEIFKK